MVLGRHVLAVWILSSSLLSCFADVAHAQTRAAPTPIFFAPVQTAPARSAPAATASPSSTPPAATAPPSSAPVSSVPDRQPIQAVSSDTQTKSDPASIAPTDTQPPSSSSVAPPEYTTNPQPIQVPSSSSFTPIIPRSVSSFSSRHSSSTRGVTNYSSSTESRIFSSQAIDSSVTTLNGQPLSVQSFVQNAQSQGSSSLSSSTDSFSSDSSFYISAAVFDQAMPPPSAFDRPNFGYNVPIFEDGIIANPHTVSLNPQVIVINIFLALLTALVAVLSHRMLLSTLLHASSSVHVFLRKVPLSLFVFLCLVSLYDFLFPVAHAQASVVHHASVGFLVPFYALIFFLVAGLTNGICNNMLSEESDRLERLLLPTKAVNVIDRTTGWKRSRLAVILFMILFALIGAHINVHFSIIPIAQPGIALVAFFTVLAAAYSKDGIRFFLAGRLHWQRWLEANILGVLFALLSIWLTRALDLTPGYLFGVPAGVFIASTSYCRREGQFELSGLIGMLAAAFVVWLVTPFASGAPVIQDFLQLLFVILLEGCFFESLPFPYLAGSSIYRWNRRIWASVCVVTTFLTLHLIWNPAGTVSTLIQSPPAFTYILLLAIYTASVTVLFLYCRVRKA